MSKEQTGRYSVVIGVGAWAVVAFLLAVATGDTVDDKEKKDVPDVIADLKSNDAQSRDRAINTIMRDRKEIIEHLISVVDPANAKQHSDDTRCAAAYLLGKLRTEEAVPVLSKVLADQLGGGKTCGNMMSPYDFPVPEALVNIGRPAVPAMIENLETSDKDRLRANSISVLYHVLGGRQHLLELLGKLEARAKDEAVIKRVKAAKEYAQEHYKETGGGPLY